MTILSIRTDKPYAEIGLFRDQEQLTYETWMAHRQLAEMIHHKLENLLAGQNLALHDLDGIVCFKGPGSFTGLRIGATVANALAAALVIPVIAESGDAWLANGIRRLSAGGGDGLALPDYGSPAYTTTPKK